MPRQHHLHMQHRRKPPLWSRRLDLLITILLVYLPTPLPAFLFNAPRRRRGASLLAARASRPSSSPSPPSTQASSWPSSSSSSSSSITSSSSSGNNNNNNKKNNSNINNSNSNNYIKLQSSTSPQVPGPLPRLSSSITTSSNRSASTVKSRWRSSSSSSSPPSSSRTGTRNPRQLSRFLLACSPGDLDAVLALVDANHNKLNPADCALALKIMTNRPQLSSSSSSSSSPSSSSASSSASYRQHPSVKASDLSLFPSICLAEDKRFKRLLLRIQFLAPSLEPGEMTRIIRTLPRLALMAGEGGGGGGGGERGSVEGSDGASSDSSSGQVAPRKMSQLLGALMGGLRRRMMEVLPSYSAQELALTVNALTKLPPPQPQRSQQQQQQQQQQDDHFEVHFLKAVSERLDNCTPQGLALLLTGLPKLFDQARKIDSSGSSSSSSSRTYLDGPFLLRFRDAVATQLLATPFLPQDLALLLNGFTNLSFNPGIEFLRLFSRQVQQVLPNCKPQDIALLFLCYAKLQWRPSPTCLSQMTDRALATMPTYRPQDWANILQAMGKMGYQPGERFLKEAVKCMDPILSRFNLQSLACVVNAFALLGYVPPKGFRRRMVGCVREGVLVGGSGRGRGLKLEEVCILLHSFGQLPALAVEGKGWGEEGKEDEDEREEEVEGEKDRFPPSLPLRSSVSSSSTDEKPRHIALVLAEVIETRLSSLSPSNLSLVLRALARLGVRPLPAGFLQKAKKCLEPSVTSLRGIESALTLHALARLSAHAGDREEEEGKEEGAAVLHGTCSSMVRSLYEQVVRQKEELHVQEVTLVINSMVRLGWPGAGVVDEMCERMEVILQGGGGRKEEKRTSSSSGASSRNRRVRRLFAMDEEEEEGGEEEGGVALSSQGLALLLGSFGHLAYVPSRRLQSLLVPVLEHHLKEGSYTARDFSMSLRGLANVPSFSAARGGGGREGGRGGGNAFVPVMTRRLIEGLEREEAVVLELGAQDVAMVVNAFAKMQIRADEQLLDDMADALLDCLPKSEGQALASVINAFARLRHHPGQAFLAAFEVEVRRRLGTLDLSSLSLILWSLVVMDASSCYSSGSCSSSTEGGKEGGRAIQPSPLSPALLEEAIALRLLPEIKAQLKYMEMSYLGEDGRVIGRTTMTTEASRVLSNDIAPSLSAASGDSSSSNRLRSPLSITRLGPQALERILCQTLQVLLYTSSSPPSSPASPFHSIPGISEIRTLVTRAWRRVAPTREKLVPSALHQEVMNCLQAEGVSFVAEQEESEGVFSLDIVLNPTSSNKTSWSRSRSVGGGGNVRSSSNSGSDGGSSTSTSTSSSSRRSRSSSSSRIKSVVVEVDGPTHYFINEPTMLMGDTIFKRRMLLEQQEENGLEGDEEEPQLKWGAVLSLTLWEWQEAGPRQQDKLAVLRRKLRREGLRLDDYQLLGRQQQRQQQHEQGKV